MSDPRNEPTNPTYSIRCWEGHQVPVDSLDSLEEVNKCPECDKSLFIQSQFSGSSAELFKARHGFWNYLEMLVPARFITQQVSLGEGNTRLIESSQSPEDG